MMLTYFAFGQSLQFVLAEKYLNDRGEVYFRIEMDQEKPIKAQVNKLAKYISVDKFDQTEITAYANTKEFNQFLEFNLNYEVLTPPSMLHQPRMFNAREVHSRTDWDFYPTYFGYLDIMDQFVENYPDLCELVNITTLESGRQILSIHINDSLGVDQNEPEFFYTSSMHGDELTGYIMTLHLIEHLLENYGSDDQITNLVNNVDIWINPLANPDGTYAGGNNTVFGATRGNANGIDFNRNFPDPEDGEHPDGNEWQPETIAFMEFAEEHDFVMGANLHGGAEVLNYPWDTWYKRHADDDWWIYICRQFADTVHAYAPSGYLTDLDNGITNGYDWYSISGGRQDYMNYFHHNREITMEISSTKLPPASQMPDFWEYLHRSLLTWMEQVIYGVHGKVYNAVNGNPVAAKVVVMDHDIDESHVYASVPVGDYHRPIDEGTYDFIFSSFGYYTKTVENVSSTEMETLILNVELEPYVSLAANFESSDTILEAGNTIDFINTSQGANIVSWNWTFEGGEPSASNDENPLTIFYNENGRYDVSLTVTDVDGGSSTLVKEDYILVTDVFLMKDTTVYLCDGLFYDSGGEGLNYQDEEAYTITFVSLLESGSLEVVFQEFEIEEESDCTNDFLEVYDGMDDEAPLVGKYCGTNIPNSITAHNINGALTFKFISNEELNLPGWKAFITCDTSVGVPDNEDNGIVIFPNPASKYFKVEGQSVIHSFSIYDLSGKLIEQTYPDNNQLYHRMDDYEPGIYLLKIESEGKVYNKKLILR